jgi:pimeloyl-ACP methyl ester carboxylesterase
MTQEIGGFAALGLHPNILAALTAVGYEEPSPIQSQAIPVILAGQDRMTPRPGAQSLIDALSDPTVVELPEAGHMAMIEEPDVARKAIVDHLARC